MWYSRTGHRWQYNTTQKRWDLQICNSSNNIDTLVIFDTYCFSTATVVMRTRPSVTLLYTYIAWSVLIQITCNISYQMFHIKLWCLHIGVTENFDILGYDAGYRRFGGSCSLNLKWFKVNRNPQLPLLNKYTPKSGVHKFSKSLAATSKF
jgi:hypothetical protein